MLFHLRWDMDGTCIAEIEKSVKSAISDSNLHLLNGRLATVSN